MKKVNKGIFVVVVLTLITSLLLGACTKTPTPTPTPATPTPTPATPAVTPIPTPKPAPEDKPTGKLTIGLASLGNELLNPTLGADTSLYMWPMFDRLVGQDPVTYEYVNEGPYAGIAQKWEVKHLDKSSVYTFFLRPGVKFHDGTEVTAKDVKFSLEYGARPKALTAYVRNIRKIKSIETPDPLTVVMTTDTVYPFLPWDLSFTGGPEGFILPKDYFEQKGEDYFAKYPIGSGPYKFKKQVTGLYIEYEAMPKHWRIGVPKFQELRLSIVPEGGTRAAMLRAGELDVAKVEQVRIKELQGAGVKIVFQGEAGGLMVMMHQPWEGYLANPKVREALNLAIDRKAIRDAIYGGMADIADYFYYGSLALGYKPYREPYTYDPEKARRLLKEAYPAGIELNVYSYVRTDAEAPRLMEAVASYWDAVGVKTKVIPIEWGVFRAKWGEKQLINSVAPQPVGNRPLWYSAWGIVFHSTAFLALMNDPKMDRLVEELETKADLADIIRLQQEIGNYARDNHYGVPGWSAKNVWGVSEKATGWQPPARGQFFEKLVVRSK